MATGAEHHAVVEGYQAVGVVVREGAVGAEDIVAIGRDVHQSFPLVPHPQGAVRRGYGVEGREAAPGVGADTVVAFEVGVVLHHTAVAREGYLAATHMHRVDFTAVPCAVARVGMCIQGELQRVVGVAAQQQATAEVLKQRERDAVHAAVHLPAVADRGETFAGGEALETLASGGVEAVAHKGEVVYRRMCAAGTQVPGLLDFVPREVDHHHTEASGEIRPAIGEADMEDAFVAGYLAALDVGEIIGAAVGDEVDIGVVVGHHQTAVGNAVGHGGHAHIAEAGPFGHAGQRVVHRVVAEHAATGRGIDTVARQRHMVDSRVVQAVAPLADGHLAPAHSRQRQQQQYQ